MPPGRLASALVVMVTVAACAGPSRARLPALADVDEVAVRAGGAADEVGVTRQARHGAAIAGFTAYGALRGFLAPLYICALPGAILPILGLAGIAACGYLLWEAGGVTLIVAVFAGSTIVGAVLGGTEAAEARRPAREAGAAAAAVLSRHALPLPADAAVEGAVTGEATRRGFHLVPAAGAASARAEVRLEHRAVLLEADDPGLMFNLRLDMRARLIVGGDEAGTADVSVRGHERRTPEDWAADDGAAVRAALARLSRQAGDAVATEVLSDLPFAFVVGEVCGLRPTTADGRRIVEVIRNSKPLRVSHADRIVAWEPWVPPAGEAPAGARVTYDLRVWDAGALVVDATGLDRPSHVLGPEVATDRVHSWSVRPVLHAAGKRFVGGWSGYLNGASCPREPALTSRLDLQFVP